MRIQVRQKILKLLTLSALMFSFNSYAACSLSSSNFVFGTYNTLSMQAKTSSSSVQVSCDSTTAISISINSGISGVNTARYMMGINDKLYYNLYLDVGMTQIFGDGSSGTYRFNGTVGNTLFSIPIYGNIPGNQNISEGSYSDTLTVMLFF
jgi:spore coat protein U-like protein